MKYPGVILAGLWLGASLHAAEPASPQPAATDAQPAVTTSPAAASDPEVGRGNPRRQQVLPGQGAGADSAAGDDSGSGSGGNGNGNVSDRTSAGTSSNASASPAAAAAPPPDGRDSADRIELEATQITGNAELPRVMYVVPWKRPELGELGGRPARSLLDEVLAPVDRDVFRRQNSYYEALRPDAAPEQP